jgi:hypothetical protein
MDTGVNRKFETSTTFDPHVSIKKTVGLFEMEFEMAEMKLAGQLYQ